MVGNAGSFQYYTEQISDEPLSPEHQALLGPPARGDNADITLYVHICTAMARAFQGRVCSFDDLRAVENLVGAPS